MEIDFLEMMNFGGRVLEMKGILIFGALIALVGWASWRLYPRQNRRLPQQINESVFRPDAERTPG
jgi:hypothetical protein